uniref:glycosyltransferase family 2 protein n=1 Tax=Flavobacterium sp. TaxID=239 RepID=UPI004047568D
MKISVIIPFYNEINYINETIKSICEQKKSEHINEIIIINDGKLDNNLIFNKIKKEYTEKIKIIKNEGEHGAGAARNIGLNNAVGDLVAFLDADDYWLPNKILNQIKLVQEGKNFITCAYLHDNSNRIHLPIAKVNVPIDILMRPNLNTSSVLVQRDLIDKLRFGGMKYHQDTKFWYDISKNKNFKYGRVEEPSIVYRQVGRTKNKLIQAYRYWKLLQTLNLKNHQLILIFISYAINGIKTHYAK